MLATRSAIFFDVICDGSGPGRGCASDHAVDAYCGNDGSNDQGIEFDSYSGSFQDAYDDGDVADGGVTMIWAQSGLPQTRTRDGVGPSVGPFRLYG